MNIAEKYLHGLSKTASLIVPLVIFYCVSALCFAPRFSGKVLPQHDIEQYRGMSQDIREHYNATGDDAQWTGAMFGGMPAYLISIRYPAQAVKNTVGQAVTLIDTPTGFIFFAMTAMWLMMLMFGMSPWTATVPALAYGLSTYFFLIIGAGHVTKMWALVYAPLMTGGIFATLRGNMWTGGVLTALFASLEIGANHPQITYYFLLAMGIFWVNELIFAIREKHLPDFVRRTAVLVAAGTAALGSNFAPLWYTSQHTPDTIRGGSELAATVENSDDSRGLDLNYATAWSYGIAESWNMLIPDFAGGDSARAFETDGAVGNTLAQYGMRQAARQLPAYWGGQPYTAGPTYLGAAAIFFALLGLLLTDNRNRWWIATAMLVMLLLAWGRNFMWFTELCFKYLPMYNKFRTVSMTLTVVEWAVPLLAGIALWQMRTSLPDRRTLLKKTAWAAGITGGFCLLFILCGGSLFDFGQAEAEDEMTAQFYYMLRASGADREIAQGLHEQLGADTAAAMVADRVAIMQADAWRSLLFIIAAAGAVILFAFKNIRYGVLIAAAALLVTLDLAFVDTRFLPHDRFVAERQAQITPSAADVEILADTDPGYRVYNLSVSTFNDATTSYFHRSIGGYHGAKLARYQDIIDYHLQSGAETETVLDMLNTRYTIERDGTVVRRETANGAAWFVESVIELPSARDEIDALAAIDTKTTAVASPKIKASKAENRVPAGHYAGTGEIRLTEYSPNRLRYEYTADDTAFAVFSEIFYDKGWSAYIDGADEPAEYLRVDYILRGMELPAGTHTVEWRFRAPSWSAAETVTAIFSALILAAAATLATIRIRRYCKKYEQQRKQAA